MLIEDPKVDDGPHESVELTEAEMLDKLDEIITGYSGKRGALIPILQMAQSLFGYLPDSVLKQIAKKLNKPLSEVAGVVSFYSFFSRVPQGRNQVRVCLGTACYVRGGKEVLAAMKKELGVEIGESTPDRCFSLEVGRCFGACGLAPVAMVGINVHQRVKPTKVKQILQSYQEADIEEHKGGAA
jgi:NADH:ubiquinone oxidoreductase subunit E